MVICYLPISEYIVTPTSLDSRLLCFYFFAIERLAKKSSRYTLLFRFREKLIASPSRRERVYKRAGESSVTFHEIAREQGLQRNFLNKKVEQSCLCSLAGAGNGNRTRAPGLGSPYSTIELYLRDIELSNQKITTIRARRQDKLQKSGAKFVNGRHFVRIFAKMQILT